jgi:dihydrofolate reductase
LRTLAITQNVTVDGSIEMLDSWFDPQGQAGVDNSDLLEELHHQSSTADGLLLGRQTFEDMRGYWPQQSDDATGVTHYLNLVQKYVVSSTMTDPEWQNSTVLSGDPVQEVHALKEQPGKDIVVTGSITLCHRSRLSWSTSTGCSYTPSCKAAAADCSPTGSSRRS